MRRMRKKLSARMVAALLFAFAASIVMGVADAQAWQQEWQNTVTAAEKEGQVTIFGPPGITYQNAIGAFQDAFPKIKLVYVPGSGSRNSQRLLAERRAEKFLADIFVGGSGTMGSVLLKGNLLDPLPPTLILPENKDQSLWFNKKHIYADPDNQLIFMMQGNINTTLAAYHVPSVDPKGIKSYWDVINPKWKGKIVAYDPRERGHIQTIRSVYYNPKLGGEFFRRLFTEMDVVVSRDQRLMIDWIAQGKYLLHLFATTNEVIDAKKKGLPVDLIAAADDESHMSGGFGHVGLVNRAPHPNAAKVFINWLLSKEGQLKWQEKSDNNSLRMDIPKTMLTDTDAIPKEGGRYLITSLPQYADVTPVVKIVDEALAKAGR